MQVALDFSPVINLTDEQFETLCQANREVRFERSAAGELIVMPPTGGETGRRNLSLAGQMWVWNQATQLGQAFDSSTGFKLPNGATRSPDVAWVKNERWQALTPQQQRQFVPLCPDFAIELLLTSDQRADTQAKMGEYLANGLMLGWLLVPIERQVEIYRPHQSVEILNNPTTLSGELILPGFHLDLTEIFTD